MLHLIKTKQELLKLINEVNQSEVFSLDFETDSLEWRTAVVVGVAIGVHGQGYYIPTQHRDYQENFPTDKVLELLRHSLEDETIVTVFHNAVYDSGILKKYRINTRNFFCTMACAFLLYGGYPRSDTRSKIGLKPLSERLLNHTMLPYKDVVEVSQVGFEGTLREAVEFIQQKRLEEAEKLKSVNRRLQTVQKGSDLEKELKGLVKMLKPKRRTKNDYVTFDHVNPVHATDYAADDALQTLRLYPVLLKKLNQEVNLKHFPLKPFVWKDEMVLVNAVIDMKLSGFPIDVDYLTELHGFYTTEIVKAKESVIILSNGNISNPNSGKQLGEYLCGELGYKPSGLTPKGAYKTDIESLKGMLSQDDTGIVEAILQVKKLVKLAGFTKNFLKFNVDGKIYANFNPYTTLTKRFSSSSPNLQQIPGRGQGAELRGIFIAPPGYKLIAVDLAQQEVRLALIISESKAAIKRVIAGEDIHTTVAQLVTGKKEVEKHERDQNKAVTFGILFGMAAQGLAKRLGVSEREAENIIRKYFDGMPELKRMIDAAQKFTLKTGFSHTIAGTKRYFPGITSYDGGMLRQAVNHIIQGSAAMQVRRALAMMYPRLEQYDAWLVAQVHDEVLAVAREDQADQVAKEIIECFETAYTMSCPFVAEATIGDNWYELKSGGERPSVVALSS